MHTLIKGVFLYKYIKNLFNNEYSMLPSFLAFYMLQSIFPTLSFILGLTRIFNVPDEVLLDIIGSLMPELSKDIILNFLRNDINQSFSLVISVLSFHIVARAIKKLSFSMNKLYNLPNQSFIKSYIKAYIFAFLLILSSAVGLALIFFFSISYRGELSFLILYPILIVYLFIAFLFVFHYLPSIRLKYKNIYTGSLFISISISLLLSLLPILNNKFIRFDSIYGSISWIIIILFLLQIISYLIYIGILINSYYLKKKTLIYIHKKRCKI